MARCFVGPPRAPTFNLTINCWQNFVGIFVVPPVALPTLVTTAQLTLGDRVTFLSAISNNRYILVPKLTDLNWVRPLFGSDYIECPAGSGRFYVVRDVDDVGKGFANEYRQVMVQVFAFPNPIT